MALLPYRLIGCGIVVQNLKQKLASDLYGKKMRSGAFKVPVWEVYVYCYEQLILVSAYDCISVVSS